jgi:hypothetical protein
MTLEGKLNVVNVIIGVESNPNTTKYSDYEGV